ncbi:hypothetical protein [Deinococcus arcticus]|uniref:Lipoprotein n=1 Tax=Deinococcus arcticus TaxID=2136176 RepID=A0A2T3W860_9DEIO|nr:hypothetical protein [Deinococcus arcticus]PTA67984.1 hypothetical protein C8263_09680 [Deinococcus arcticus]
MLRRFLGWTFLALTLSACDLQGLDVYSPVSARDYVRSCARSATDVYCRALLPTLAAVSGPVTVLAPNLGDDERAALLGRLLAEKGLSTEAFLRDEAAKAAFARANIFAVDRLTSGLHRTLDGQPHQVRCALEGQRVPPLEVCSMDNLSGMNHLQPGSGSVYATLAPGADALPFFRF